MELNQNAQVPQSEIPAQSNPQQPVNTNLPSPHNWIKLIIIFLFLVIIGSGGYYYLGLGVKNNRPISKNQQVTTSPMVINISQVQNNSIKNDDSVKYYINSLHVYLHQYYGENEVYPARLNQLVGKYIIADTINNPYNHKEYAYIPSSDFKSYTLKATLSNGEDYEGDAEAQSKIFESVIWVDIRQIQSSLEMYRADQGGYPSDLSNLIPTYINNLHKTNPYTFKDYQYILSSDRKSYTLTTELPNRQTYKVTNPY